MKTNHQQQAVAVDAEIVGGANRGDPVRMLDELEILAAVELEGQPQARQERHERPDIGPQLNRIRLGGRDQ
jgi:hypothetical protein